MRLFVLGILLYTQHCLGQIVSPSAFEIKDTSKPITVILSANHYDNGCNQVILELAKGFLLKTRQSKLFLEAPFPSVYYYQKEQDGKLAESFFRYTLFDHSPAASGDFKEFLQKNRIEAFGYDCTRLTSALLLKLTSQLVEIYSANNLPIPKNEFEEFKVEINRSFGYGHRLVAFSPDKKEFINKVFPKLLSSLQSLKKYELAEHFRHLYMFYLWIMNRNLYYDYEENKCEKSLRFEHYRDSVSFENFRKLFSYENSQNQHALIDAGSFHFFGDANADNKESFVERLINYYGRRKIATLCVVPKKQIDLPRALKRKLTHYEEYDVLSAEDCLDYQTTDFKMFTLCPDNQTGMWLKKYDYIIITK